MSMTGPSIAAAVFVVLLGVSCSSGTKVQPTPAQTDVPATPVLTVAAIERPISDTDAMNLTLVAIDFGPAFAGYAPAKSTSALTVADLEGDPCTVDILAAVKEFRFERGYNRDWINPDAARADLDTSVGSYVEIYPDDAAAHGKFAFDQGNASKPAPAACDVHVSLTTTFPVSSPPGEEAFGYRKTIANTAGTQMIYTWTEFRRGRVVASTDVIRKDALDTATETTQFAHTLDRNISRLLNIS